MAFEDGKPWLDGTIERCEAPHHLAVRTKGGYGEKLLSLKLSESAGTPTLEFVHHSVNRKAVGELGPGREFYAVIEGRAKSRFRSRLARTPAPTSPSCGRGL
jgi:hypothetical protein